MADRIIKILTIDDNQDNLISLKALLKEAFPKAAVFTALNGHRGLELATAEDPDVILLDIVMPGMDGFEVCRKLKANAELSDIPVVFVTAIKGDKEHRILALESGAEAFLAKPIEESELTAQVRAMVKIKNANIEKRNEKERLAELVEEQTRELKRTHLTTLNLLEDLKRENEARKKSESALLEAQRLAYIGSYEEDLTNGETTYSDELLNIYGISRSEFTEKQDMIFLLVHPQDREDVLKSKKVAIAEKRTADYICRIVRPSGEERIVNFRFRPVFDVGGSHVRNMGTVQDITERKQAEIELREAKDYLEKLIGYASAPIVVWNEKFEITTFNGAFEILTGRKADEVLGKSLAILFPPLQVNESMTLIANTHAGKNLKSTEIDVIHVNGSVRTVLWNSATIRDSDYINPVSTIAQGLDITDRKRISENLYYFSNHDHLTGLYNRRFYEEEVKRLDVERNLPITIVMADINGLKLINDSFGHAKGDELLRKAAEEIKKGCRADDIVARLGGDEFVILLPRTDTSEAEDIIKRIKDYSLNKKVETIDISISFGYETKRNKEDNIQEILKKAEDHMYRHKLYESSSTRGKTIDLIMNTLFEKSNREMMHSKRVSEISETIAINMNLDKETINQVRTAGLMHDIGKMGIDEKILNKPGRLSNDEWQEIFRHPEIGYRILSSVNEFSEIATYILEHHERWDGKGYPKGLKGQNISLQARIIAVADACDAMTSDRSYRKGLSEEEAIDEIKRCSGTQFDPNITKALTDRKTEKTEGQGLVC